MSDEVQNTDQDLGEGGKGTVVPSVVIHQDNSLKADAQEAGRFLTVSEIAKIDRGSAAATQYFLDSRRTILEGFLQNDPSPLVRHEAAFALGCIGNHSNVFALRSALASDVSPLVRHEAALALSEIGEPCSIPYLRVGLRDDNHEVSISCRIALARLEQHSSSNLASPEITTVENALRNQPESCACPYPNHDPWRCAVAQNLSTEITCKCPCHTRLAGVVESSSTTSIAESGEVPDDDYTPFTIELSKPTEARVGSAIGLNCPDDQTRLHRVIAMRDRGDYYELDVELLLKPASPSPSENTRRGIGGELSTLDLISRGATRIAINDLLVKVGPSGTSGYETRGAHNDGVRECLDAIELLPAVPVDGGVSERNQN